MATFVLFDLEFTSWAGALEQDWSAPGQLREIVEIGALRLDENDYSIVDEYVTLVRPTFSPQLSSYFTELTGIEQGRVEEHGLPAAAALSDFLGFCRGQAAFCYGNDMVVLGENVGWARSRGDAIANGFLGASFLNIRPLINAMAPATSSSNVGLLWQVLGLPRPASGDQHSAIFDCYSLAATIRHLCRTANSPLEQVISYTARGTKDR